MDLWPLNMRLSNGHCHHGVAFEAIRCELLRGPGKRSKVKTTLSNGSDLMDGQTALVEHGRAGQTWEALRKDECLLSYLRDRWREHFNQGPGKSVDQTSCRSGNGQSLDEYQHQQDQHKSVFVESRPAFASIGVDRVLESPKQERQLYNLIKL